MKKIDGAAKSVADLLRGKQYKIDYYQREYKWESKQIQELVADLTSRFQEEFDPEHERKAVQGYPYYFLGSVIISEKDNERYVVDGQQRMTSLTLLLTYLHRVATTSGNQYVTTIGDLIYSEAYGAKSFNLDVADRRPSMEALFEGQEFDASDASESVQNLVARFGDIEAAFPNELTQDALPFFVDWLINKVLVVEITAYADDDAYVIFETMNDRGLQLQPVDMIKGYLLASIDDGDDRASANDLWRARMADLREQDADADADFLKTWLRSQYADSIRERKKNAVPQDWDRIGTEFHRWLRDNADRVGLGTSADFRRFITRDLDRFATTYVTIEKETQTLQPTPGLEHIGYNADRAFTLQHQLLLAPLTVDDSAGEVRTKLEIVARFVDVFLARRIWNQKSIAYSTLSYTMFNVMRSIRRSDVGRLAETLHRALAGQEETFATNDRLGVHQQNRWQLQRTLARITDHVEVASGGSSRYVEYVTGRGKKAFEVEHVWADHHEDHLDEFEHEYDFAEMRNRIGGLLLLPKSFNASFGDDPYAKKVQHYLSQNLLARSLHPQCYENNPGFVRFAVQSGLPFRPYESFTAEAIRERSDLYRQIAERVWDPDALLAVAEERHDVQ